VLAGIAARYADRTRILAQLDARPTDRFPNTALNRFRCTRDRTCVWPGCRRSAVNLHIDHTRDHTESGPTTQTNTAPATTTTKPATRTPPANDPDPPPF
jgi:hypothetical protein